MAAARKTPELGGYDYEFTVQVRDNCECPVSITNERSSSDCRMWTQTLLHLHEITLAVNVGNMKFAQHC